MTHKRQMRRKERKSEGVTTGGATERAGRENSGLTVKVLGYDDSYTATL